MGTTAYVCPGCGATVRPGEAPAPPELRVSARLELPVQVEVPLTGGDSSFQGRGKLFVTGDGMRLRVEGTFGFKEAALEWASLRNLRNTLEARTFTARFDHRDRSLLMIVRLEPNDVAALKAVFDQLPERCVHPVCPACAGVVKGGKCVQCGASFGAAHAKLGLLFIIPGCLVTLVGLGGALAFSSVPKVSGWLVGLALTGACLIGVGVRKTIFRDRA